jgi:ribosomal protein S18 acetylase RimI-like enzyme
MSHSDIPLAIRPAVPDDAAALAALAERTFRETYATMCRADDLEAYIAAHFGAARQREELEDAAMTTLLATERGGVLAGYGQLRHGEAPAVVAGARPAEVARFYVDRPWQGRGVASALMTACLTTLARGGADAAWLGVFRANARAVRFYEKCGFTVVGLTTFTMGSDVQDDYVMARSLAAIGG